jgi:hypothetical protein
MVPTETPEVEPGYSEANSPHSCRRYSGGRSKRRPYGEKFDPGGGSIEISGEAPR